MLGEGCGMFGAGCGFRGLRFEKWRLECEMCCLNLTLNQFISDKIFVP